MRRWCGSGQGGSCQLQALEGRESKIVNGEKDFTARTVNHIKH